MATTTARVPRPPGSYFYVIKTLSDQNSTSGVYLCLYRDLAPFTPSQDVSFAVTEDAEATMLDSFSRITGNPPLHQKIRLLQGTEMTDFVYQRMLHNGTSTLLGKHFEMLTQLVVIKMHTEKKTFRNEVNMIQGLHDENKILSSMSLGSCVTSCTLGPEVEWACASLRPVFGPTLQQFGESNVEHGGIPG